MSLSIADFWKLVDQSRLLNMQQCQQLNFEFRGSRPPAEANNPQLLADWLVERNIFSRYQAQILLAGHAGPFLYGDYKIYDRLEQGRLAGNFRAVHAQTGHPVMLHFLTGAVVQDPHAWAHAANLGQVACTLNHPHILRYFEIVDLGSFKFLVHEDLHGETVEERLAAGRVPFPEAARWARMAALGLAGLHTTGRAHGDVRPVNIWLDPPTPYQPAGLKLMYDACSLPQPPNLALDDPHGLLLAQSDYLAPEFQMPGKQHDALTDLYALGCTLYTLLAGHPPFPGGTALQKMARHAQESIRPLEAYGVPAPLAHLVAYLMAKNPSLRYQDAQTVADQLAAFIDPQILHFSTGAPLPTLPSFEAALKQAQATLAARTMQQSFGGAPAAPQVAAGPEAPAIPTGKAVTAKKEAAPAPGVVAPTGSKSPALSKETAAKLQQAKEEREKRKLVVTLVSVGVGLILLILALNYFGRGGSTPVAENGENPNTKSENTNQSENNASVPPVEVLNTVQSPIVAPTKTETTQPKVDNTAGTKTSEGPMPAQEVVPDDGKLLWASPTTGTPVDLKYVPPEGRIFLSLRPAALLASAEGERVFQALGPALNARATQFAQWSGLPLKELSRLTVTLHDNESKFPRVSLVGSVEKELTTEEWLGKWGNPEAKQKDQATYYLGSNGWAYYLPAAENGKSFVMATEKEILEVIESPFPLLSTEISQLRLRSDADRHVTLLFYPTYVFSGGGDTLFTEERARVKQPLSWLLGDGLQAGSVSMHFDKEFYFEMRYQTKIDKEPLRLADEFRQRLAKVPDNLLDYFATQLNPPPYWKKFSLKFPGMIEKLHEQMRVGVEDKQAVVNALLPVEAAHNLILGTELTMATAPGGGAGLVSTAAPKGPQSLEEAVKVTTSLSFANLSLENSLLQLESDLKGMFAGAPFESGIHIIGGDLQLDGITKNQAVRDFNQDKKPISEILTAIVMKANPITTVKDPSELDQKLIWVIGADPDDGKTRIIVTTRAGAEKRKYKLPPPFQPKS